jgi:hypothetical protein
MVALQVKRLSEGYKQMEEAVQDLPCNCTLLSLWSQGTNMFHVPMQSQLREFWRL